MQTLPPNSRPKRAPEHHQVQELEMEYFARCENVSQEAEGFELNPSKGMALPPMEDVYTEDMPFGNPDLVDDAPASSKFFSSTLPTARRVTLENENSPLYNEFDAAYTNGGNFQQEYSFTSFEHPKVEIAEACAMPTNDTPPFGNIDDSYSVSSCEHIASPDHVQSKFRPSFNDFSWAEKHSQAQQGVATPRQVQLTPVVYRQRPLATYFLGSAAGHQSSPLSVTSPTYTSSALDIHSQPAFKNQTRSRRQTSRRQSFTPKPGAITNFFPVKTPGTNEFHRL
jgi:hypothetical protein